MKSEKLMHHIGQIDDSIIIEADLNLERNKPKKQSMTNWIFAAAAIICIIVAAPIIQKQIQPTENNTNDFSDLPKLALNLEFGGMGFEGRMAYYISELQNGNPWTEDNDLTTMPVFINTDYIETESDANDLSPEEMISEAKKIANLFELEIISLQTYPTIEESEIINEKLKEVNASEEELIQNTAIYEASAQCDGVKIDVQKSGRVILTLTPETANLVNDIKKLNSYNDFAIVFDGYEGKIIDGTIYRDGLPLPNGYKFTYDNLSHDDAMEITQYLFSEYGSFTEIKTPAYDLFADYTYDGNLTRLNTTVFENDGTLTERILNYHFDRLDFNASGLGGLDSIMYTKTDLSQKIGDYPIITAEEARKLLLENNYITTVPEELPNEKYIARVELIYRTTRWDSLFMPYYKFWVEMPTMQSENGLKTFGAFYVPAVQSEFLENTPLWDGNFN